MIQTVIRVGRSAYRNTIMVVLAAIAFVVIIFVSYASESATSG